MTNRTVNTQMHTISTVVKNVLKHKHLSFNFAILHSLWIVPIQKKRLVQIRNKKMKFVADITSHTLQFCNCGTCMAKLSHLPPLHNSLNQNCIQFYFVLN